MPPRACDTCAPCGGCVPCSTKFPPESPVPCPMRTPSLDVLLLVNTPTLGAEHPDRASEAGVLESAAAITLSLESAGHRVRTLDVDAPGPALWQRIADAGKPDVVFNLFEGFAGRGEGEPQVASLIELAGL